MANFGLYEKPYIKIGTSSDVCYCCVKDTCAKEQRDAYDVTHELRGRIADQLVFYIRRSGVDTCICFDCFKKLYEDIVAKELPATNEAPVVDETPVVEAATDTVNEEPTKENTKETKKASSKKSK